MMLDLAIEDENTEENSKNDMSNSRKSIGKRVYTLIGKLLPKIHLHASMATHHNISLGKHIVLNNITFTFDGSEESATVVANMLVLPPNMDSLHFKITGIYVVKTKTATLTGEQVGDWQLPGGQKHIDLSRAKCSMVLSFAPDSSTNTTKVTVSGSVQAQVSYGKVTGFVGFKLPPIPGAGGVFGAEMEISKGLSLRSLPGASSAYPAIGVESAQLIWCGVPGMYTTLYDGSSVNVNTFFFIFFLYVCTVFFFFFFFFFFFCFFVLFHKYSCLKK